MANIVNDYLLNPDYYANEIGLLLNDLFSRYYVDIIKAVDISSIYPNYFTGINIKQYSEIDTYPPINISYDGGFGLPFPYVKFNIYNVSGNNKNIPVSKTGFDFNSPYILNNLNGYLR